MMTKFEKIRQAVIDLEIAERNVRKYEMTGTTQQQVNADADLMIARKALSDARKGR